MLGIVLLILAIIPAGDMSLIYAARGSTGKALRIHGLATVLMVAAALLLI